MLGDAGGVLQPHHGKARAEQDVKCSNTGDWIKDDLSRPDTWTSSALRALRAVHQQLLQDYQCVSLWQALALGRIFRPAEDYFDSCGCAVVFLRTRERTPGRGGSARALRSFCHA